MLVYGVRAISALHTGSQHSDVQGDLVMSNPNTSIFVLSALGIFMLTDNALASVSVIGGQLINDRNQVIPLRVAAASMCSNSADPCC
jgi:hypothetical protein